ncbi:Ubiquitin--protein ligase [Bertholletia excelsa]
MAQESLSSDVQFVDDVAQESLSDVQFVDDFYFSALSHDNEDDVLPISDAKYAEGLQLQEALMSSVIASKQGLIINTPLLTIHANAASVQEPLTVIKEPGQSSSCFCEICADKKEAHEMFTINACSHSFCSDCVTQHVSIKIAENSAIVRCPGSDCSGMIELESCRSRMSSEMIARWDELLCESMIPASEKFYCPFKDCSALMVNDGSGGILESECPVCHRLFCAQCYVPWHDGIACEEFQRLNEDERGRDDLMVRELAKSQKWKRCPFCKYYVEKTQGCLHMTCRCGSQFCYACGAVWSDTHGGCQVP